MNGTSRTTIFALSSGPLPAAVAVVRVSGPAAGAAVRALAGRLPAERRATLLLLKRADETPLDRALVLWLPGPGSATGEDMAELQLHGGRATVAAVLDELATLPGLVPAEAGEFTRRAVEHGRLDLAEAEGLADLLEAQTETQRRAALRLVEGGMARQVAAWERALLRLAAQIEAAIEFAEDHDDVTTDPLVRSDIAQLAHEIGAALDQPPAERLRDGVRVVIAGPVNAGKSSLLNALAGRDVAIALPQEGTTRDLIEAPIILGGSPLILIDSAGLRDATDEAERIGVERAQAAMASADLLLWLGDPASCPTGKPALKISTMSDLPQCAQGRPGCDLAISTRSGEGMEQLRACLAARVRELLPREDDVALNARHRALLREVVTHLQEAVGEGDDVLTADRVRSARLELDRLTGRVGVEDMLDTLFARFCVGK